MRTALVTGSSTGIGAACVARLAGSGWTVLAGVRRDEDGERLRAASGAGVQPVLLDVTDGDAIRRVVDDLAARVGDRGLQGLVNNAGIGIGGPVELVEPDDWRAVFEVNVIGAVATTRACMPLLRAGRGRVVHIGSMSGRIAAPGVAPYSASKHALEALAESMRHEMVLAGERIRVSLVEPGEVATPIWDKTSVAIDGIEAVFDEAGRRRYGWMVDQGRGLVDEGRAKGIDPDRVAEAVEHALTARRPRARYLVGRDAQLAGHVIARLPDRWRDVLVRAQARNLARRGRRAT